MLEVLFDDQGLIHYEFIPEGHTMNKEMCVEILCHFRDAMRGKHQKKICMKQLLSSVRKYAVLIGYWWSKCALPSTCSMEFQ
jgi:hypothetical protein